MKVYQAINAVQTDLAQSGISKDRTHDFDRYQFRGIDDVYNVLSPLLAKHGLCILPRMLTRTCEERQSQKGGALFYVTVEAEFDFVSAEDGSKHVVKTFGEAMDRGDKATNKAMSAAYKYAAFQAFAIPTEGDNDADSQTHEVKKRGGVVAQVLETSPKLPKPVREVLDELADTLMQLAASGQPIGEVCNKIEEANMGNDEKIYLWSLLPSPLRSAIKAHQLKQRKDAA